MIRSFFITDCYVYIGVLPHVRPLVLDKWSILILVVFFSCILLTHCFHFPLHSYFFYHSQFIIGPILFFLIFVMWLSTRANGRLLPTLWWTFYTFTINQHMCIYKYVQSHIIFHEHVSFTPVTIIRVSYNKNTINIQITVQKCMIKSLGVTLDFPQYFLWS